MLLYYINYLIVFGLSSLNSFKLRASIFFKALIFIILFLFAASRGKHTGMDYAIHANNFQKLTSTQVEYFPDRVLFYEPAYYIMPKVGKFICEKYYIYITFSLFAFLGIIVKFNAFKYSNSDTLSIILYIGTYYILHDLIQIRAGVGAGIFLYAIKFIYNRNLLKYFICIIAACFFHYSCLVFLPLFFLNPFKLNKNFYIIILSTCCMCSILGINLFNPAFFSFIPKINVYLELMEQGEYDEIRIWTNPGFLINLFVTFLLLIKATHVNPYNKYFIIMLKISVFSILAYVTLSSMPVLAGRIGQLLGIVQLILYPCLIFTFKERLVGYFVPVIISVLYLYNYTLKTPVLFPYYTWWSI